MNSLPSSIETYFQEAGFSGTEIAIVKKLVEGDAMTLRDLAFKTGKSTGVLDQAMKKLLKKKIVVREMINGTPKYVLHSLESVSKWLQDDMKQKKNVLELRHQNFESFIASITSGKKRPEMQFFQGAEGLKKAYTLLLEKGNDFVQYGPVLYTETEDPLREFNVQYFRERRKRNIFLRVIAHNTPLGRRFQNRDPFEYRKTVLVNENLYPFAFEKIVVGNTVACFQHETQEACFIEYKELAERERHFFERLWNMKLQHPDEGVEPVADTHPMPIVPVHVEVPRKTKLLSQVREFFLSPQSVVAFIACGILSAGITYFLYQQNVDLNLRRVQERVKSIAATGISQFNIDDINAVENVDDLVSFEYQRLFNVLNQIRKKNDSVRFVYLIRPTNDPQIHTFIADADVIPGSKISDYKNGQNNNSLPGTIYDAGPNSKEWFIKEQAAYYNIATDSWGTVVTGSAPIVDNGKTIAILGVDVSADEVYILSRSSFIATYYFLGFFVLLIVFRLFSFNRLWTIYYS